MEGIVEPSMQSSHNRIESISSEQLAHSLDDPSFDVHKTTVFNLFNQSLLSCKKLRELKLPSAVFDKHFFDSLYNILDKNQAKTSLLFIRFDSGLLAGIIPKELRFFV